MYEYSEFCCEEYYIYFFLEVSDEELSIIVRENNIFERVQERGEYNLQYTHL